MKGLRAARALLLAAATLTACGPVQSAPFGRDAGAELDGGRRYAAALVSQTRVSASPAQAIQLGYLERARMGLGSPFRLMEYALEDPRLAKPEREALAWALMAGALDGTGYRVDPRTLSVDGDPESGARQLELIEGAIGSAADPDAGELALRLAFGMAAAEGTVPATLPLRAAHATALLRDRVVSRKDARHLLEVAEGDSAPDPLKLLTVWRVNRRFRVESPTILPVSADAEREAIALAPRLLEGIRSIHDRPRVGPLNPAPEPRQRSLLSAAAAERLSELSADSGGPPETPVVVALAPFDPAATGRPREGGPDGRFFARALNEEELAAEYAVLSHRTLPSPGERLAVMSAAVAMRAYGQERPWFPGFGGPTDRDLEDRFGLASVSFPDGVPAPWRPYYRRMLESALSDLQRVMPSLDVRGLKVRFEARPGSPGTLAVHDPRTRTVYLPAATAAGTIAHEVAHDLDWQTALRRYRVRGDYATDRAVRLADGRFARALDGLTTASLAPGVDTRSLQSHATRPAEVFARSVDWFVAVSLAREGRINGYLSSVQDDYLTGYGTVRPPDVTGRAGQALITLLDNVAPVYSETRRWFLQSYGRMRSPTAYDLARRVLEAPLPDPSGGSADALPPVPGILLDQELTGVLAPPDSAPAPGPPAPMLARMASVVVQLDRLESVRDSVLASVEGRCAVTDYGDGTLDARRRVVADVASARARGLVVSLAAQLLGPAGGRWAEGTLEGHEVDAAPSPAVVAAFTPLMATVEAMGRPDMHASPLDAGPALGACPAASPFDPGAGL